MKNIKFLILLLASVAQATSLYAQNAQQTKDAQLWINNSLHYGDVLPDAEVELRLGDTESKVHLSDFKGKVIILDTWATDCPSCIEQLPEMLALQEKFKDQIQIIEVTHNSAAEINELWKKYGSQFSISVLYAAKHMTFITSDTLLSLHLFRSTNLGTQVWIDKSQVYQAMTEGTTTNAENIKLFLEGKPVDFDDYYPAVIDQDHIFSSLGKLDDFQQQLQSFSFFVKRIPGNLLGNNRDLIDSVTNKKVGLIALNQTILQLYNKAYENQGKKYKISYFHDWDILLEVNDLKKYVMPPDAQRFKQYDWEESNVYGYSLKLPIDKADKLNDKMVRDLDEHFGLESKIEMRNVKCMVLKRITKEDKLKSKGGAEIDSITFDANGKCSRIQQNQTFDRFSDNVGSFAYFSISSFMPFIDEVKYRGKIDAVLPFDEDGLKMTLADYQQFLKKYGMTLVEEYRIRPMLVLHERAYNTTKLTK